MSFRKRLNVLVVIGLLVFEGAKLRAGAVRVGC